MDILLGTLRPTTQLDVTQTCNVTFLWWQEEDSCDSVFPNFGDFIYKIFIYICIIYDDNIYIMISPALFP